MRDVAAVPAHPPAALFVFDLSTLNRNDASLDVPTGFRLETVSSISAADRPATYRLEQLWAMERGWISQPHAWTDNLALHLVQDYPSTSEGFTLLARDGSGQVVGMHGAQLEAPGIGRTGYLVVEPAFRGNGLGRALKAWQLRTAQQVGWHTLHSDTPGDDAAVGVRAMNAALGGRLVASFD